MRLGSKLLLGVVTLFCPVVMSACYGPGYGYFPEDTRDLKPEDQAASQEVSAADWQVDDSATETLTGDTEAAEAR